LTCGLTLRSLTKLRAYGQYDDVSYGRSGGGGKGYGRAGGKGYGRGDSKGYGRGDGKGYGRGDSKGYGQGNSGSLSIQELTAAKRERESRRFFAYQKQLVERGLPIPGGGKGKGRGRGRSEEHWRREERALFKTAHVSAGIRFDKYDDIPVERKGGTGNEEPVESFQELCEKYQLPEDLVANIERCQYKVPTPVQKHSMAASLSGSDVMVSAQTGSGKTAAFLVPVITAALRAGSKPICEGPVAPSCIVLAPTRELCQQISMEAKRLCFRSACNVVSIYGGADALPQLKELAEGCDIAICTPGRLDDFLGRGVMTMKGIKYLVLDEADRMLDMGFEPQIRTIIQDHGMPPAGSGGNARQTMMFSATFPREMQEMALDYLAPDYLWIGVGRVGSTVASVQQRFTDVNRMSDEGKFDKLLDTLNEVKSPDGGSAKTIVFANQKAVVEDLSWQLSDARIRNAQIHGGLSQNQRDRALQALKSGRADVLVATDVAARGLDLPGIDHIINYQLALNVDDYVHRIGRTGRMGNTGVATSFVTSSDPALRDVVKNLQKSIEEEADSASEVPNWLFDMTMRRGRGGGGQSRFRPRSAPPRSGGRDNFWRGGRDEGGMSYGSSGGRGGSFSRSRSYEIEGGMSRSSSGGRGGSFSRGRSYDQGY